MKTILQKLNTYKEELEHLKLLKKEKTFLIRNGYFCNFPKIYDKHTYLENLRQYHDLYIKTVSKWNTESENFYKKIEYFFGKKINKSIEIKYTCYGPGGHYFSKENKVVVNINSPHIIYIIKHEIVHLLVEPYILKYKIKHENKERLVNSIMNIRPVAF